MQFAAGALVTPQVRLNRPPGEGGMGSLWVADHLAMQCEVAVKFVFMDLVAQDPTILERFEREAEVLVQLDHPNIVKLFERGQTDDGNPFIVMELLLGETLVDRLERTGEMTPAQVGYLLDQLAAGLDHVHQKGIIHRDLKAENIFLVGPDSLPQVKILDFGLSRPPGDPGDKKLTAVGTLVGTAEFMSPEQIVSSMDVNHSADLWGMAVLAYMMLLAARPFEGEKLSQVLLAVRLAEYEPPTKVLPSLPPGLDGWFARSFDINFKLRFQSALEASTAWQAAIGAPAADAQPALAPAVAGQALDATVVSAGVAAPLQTPVASSVGGPVAASVGPVPPAAAPQPAPAAPPVAQPLDVTAVSAGIGAAAPPAASGPGSQVGPVSPAGPMSGAMAGPPGQDGLTAARTGPNLVVIVGIGVAVLFLVAVVIVFVAAC
ncbi:MAG: serine/threonine protein kinase [Deltaproteobacteria bacterium]|nr:serine/threonine protein kinase [Deltaproteobacteria bacterium]